VLASSRFVIILLEGSSVAPYEPEEPKTWIFEEGANKSY
jgi:hypothetical protein